MQADPGTQPLRRRQVPELGQPAAHRAAGECGGQHSGIDHRSDAGDVEHVRVDAAQLATTQTIGQQGLDVAVDAQRRRRHRHAKAPLLGGLGGDDERQRRTPRPTNQPAANGSVVHTQATQQFQRIGVAEWTESQLDDHLVEPGIEPRAVRGAAPDQHDDRAGGHHLHQQVTDSDPHGGQLIDLVDDQQRRVVGRSDECRPQLVGVGGEGPSIQPVNPVAAKFRVAGDRPTQGALADPTPAVHVHQPAAARPASASATSARSVWRPTNRCASSCWARSPNETLTSSSGGTPSR